MIYPSILKRLRSQHDSIPKIILDKDDEKLYKSPAPVKWSAFDNIVHLAKYQPAFIDRINTILETDEPVFERYSADNDPEFAQWQQWTLDEVWTRLQQDRERLFALISNLTDEEIRRIGIHKKYGRLDIANWTEFFLLHEAHHIFTVFKLVNDVEI